MSDPYQLKLDEGNRFQENGRFEAAVDSYDQAIVIAPGKAEAYYKRGNVFLKTNQFDAAVES